MEAKITIEKQINENVYFEVEPLDPKYIDKMKYSTELKGSIEDEKKMISFREQVLKTASEGFDKYKDDVVL